MVQIQAGLRLTAVCLPTAHPQESYAARAAQNPADPPPIPGAEFDAFLGAGALPLPWHPR